MQEYDYIMRIDEDCIISFHPDMIFYKLVNHALIYGTIFGDSEWVTHGLNQFSLDFMFGHNDRYQRELLFKVPDGPYTNVMAFNLDLLRRIKPLQEYIKAVDESNNIYIHRWGDLPLWGECVEYFIPQKLCLKTSEIGYYHESHDAHINI